MSSEQSIKAKVSARPFVSRRLAGEDEPVWYAPPLGAIGSAIYFRGCDLARASAADMAAFARLTPSKASSTSAVIAGESAQRASAKARNPFRCDNDACARDRSLQSSSSLRAGYLWGVRAGMAERERLAGKVRALEARVGGPAEREPISRDLAKFSVSQGEKRDLTRLLDRIASVGRLDTVLLSNEEGLLSLRTARRATLNVSPLRWRE